jgi:hypothetical protein
LAARSGSCHSRHPTLLWCGSARSCNPCMYRRRAKRNFPGKQRRTSPVCRAISSAGWEPIARTAKAASAARDTQAGNGSALVADNLVNLRRARDGLASPKAQASGTWKFALTCCPYLMPRSRLACETLATAALCASRVIPFRCRASPSARSCCTFARSAAFRRGFCPNAASINAMSVGHRWRRQGPRRGRLREPLMNRA